MANPQSGFTQIPNELFEQLPRFKFNASQIFLIHCIWRNTWGWRRQDHEFSISFLAEATGIHPSQVKKEMKLLIDSKVLTVTKEATKREARKISFNTSIAEWMIGKRGEEKEGGDSRHMKLDTSEGSNSGHQTGIQLPPQQRNSFKENIKEKNTLKEQDKIRYADTVLLTKEQYEKLTQEFGQESVNLYIEKLDAWQTNNPRKTKKDHAKTIRVWILNDQAKRKAFSQQPTSRQQRTQQQMDILQQFYREGEEEYEQTTDLAAPSGYQISLPGF